MAFRLATGLFDADFSLADFFSFTYEPPRTFAGADRGKKFALSKH
jgi:hypothetical protein